jgi:hypothetical protein
MPIETTIDSDSGLRVHVGTGVVTPDELMGELRSAYERPDYRPDAGSLCDLRDAEPGSFTGAAVKQVVDMVLAHRGAPPGVKTAIVVGRDLVYGLARMFEQQLEAKSPADVMVFRDIDEARAWLDAGRDQ